MSRTDEVTLVNVMDGRFGTAEGHYYSHHMGYDRYGRYLASVFDRSLIVARAFPEAEAPPSNSLVTGPKVDFIPLPPYQGVLGFLRSLPAIYKVLTGLMRPNTHFLLRVPGTVSLLAALILRVKGIPFSVECVADPADQLARGSMRHPLRALARLVFIASQRWQCKSAEAATYVTERALQARYPAGSKSFSWTDIVLTDECYAEAPKSHNRSEVPTNLISIGMMTQLYKGQDTLLHAVGQLRSMGHDVSLTLIGDGRYRPYFEDLARSLGIDRHVHFLGRVPAGDSVRQHIDAASIFVMPSRQEGLPRALLEAMARGLPCVASSVGGIPELLNEEALVCANDPDGLAKKISHFICNSHVYNANAQRNLDRSRDFHYEKVGAKRRAFYEYLRLLAHENSSRN